MHEIPTITQKLFALHSKGREAPVLECLPRLGRIDLILKPPSVSRQVYLIGDRAIHLTNIFISFSCLSVFVPCNSKVHSQNSLSQFDAKSTCCGVKLLFPLSWAATQAYNIFYCDVLLDVCLHRKESDFKNKTLYGTGILMKWKAQIARDSRRESAHNIIYSPPVCFDWRVIAEKSPPRVKLGPCVFCRTQLCLSSDEVKFGSRGGETLCMPKCAQA